MKKETIFKVEPLLFNKEDGELIMLFTDFMVHSKWQMSTSLYETVLVASIEAADNKPLFPKQLQEAIEMQNREWDNLQIRKGSAISHLAILNTLTLINALLKHNRNKAYDEIIFKGLDFIERAILVISGDQINFVGSDMIIPAQIELLFQHAKERRNLLNEKKIETLKSLLQTFHGIRKYKLDSFSMKKPSSMWFSLESIPENLLNVQFLNQLVNENGHFMSSPSAMAAIYEFSQNPRILDYFKEAEKATAGKGWPVTYPMNVFESIWVVGALINCNFSKEFILGRFEPLLQMIKENFSEKGTGSAKNFPPDCDDSGKALFNFSRLGVNLPYDIQVLRQWYFEEGKYFKTYDYEKDVSISTNIHALQASLESDDISLTAKSRLWGDIMTLLENTGVESESHHSQIHWQDKWVITPLYTIMGAVYTIIRYESQFPQRKTDAHHKAINWILGQQQDSGGFQTHMEFGATMEETAYALIALVHYLNYYKDGNIGSGMEDFDLKQRLLSSIQKGLSFLEKNKEQMMNIGAHPPFWVCKTLFCPYKIVITYVLGAYFLAKEFLLLDDYE